MTMMMRTVRTFHLPVSLLQSVSSPPRSRRAQQLNQRTSHLRRLVGLCTLGLTAPEERE